MSYAVHSTWISNPPEASPNRVKAEYAEPFFPAWAGPTPRNNAPWTPAEVELLKEEWLDGCSGKEIMARHGRTWSGISSKLETLWPRHTHEGRHGMRGAVRHKEHVRKTEAPGCDVEALREAQLKVLLKKREAMQLRHAKEWQALEEQLAMVATNDYYP